MDLTNDDLIEVFNNFGVDINTANNVNNLTENEDFSEITSEDSPTPEAEETQEESDFPVEELLFDETTQRFSDATWYKAIQETSVTLAGLGGIGSFVAFLLGRVKPKEIYMYDDDSVEMANLAGQLYGVSKVGKSKVAATYEIIKDTSNYNNIFCIHSKFISQQGRDIMICGFDNMAARADFFKSWLKNVNSKTTEEEKSKCLFIDGRLAAEEFQVYCITGDNKKAIEEYNKKCLFRDTEAEETVCSYKQTSFCSMMIGAVMVNLFVNFIANTLNPIFPRSVPFKVYYEAVTTYFKTETL